MSENQWARMPVWWQRDTTILEEIRKETTGTAIAALKIYIALCLKAKNGSPSNPTVGCAKRSLTELQALAGASRPMVIAGVKVLRAQKIIKKSRQFVNIYKIANYHSAPFWVKLPTAYLFKGGNMKTIKRISELPSGGIVVRDGLLLFLYLASIIDRNTKKPVFHMNAFRKFWASPIRKFPRPSVSL